jgi:CheY-like chemotaxis protein
MPEQPSVDILFVEDNPFDVELTMRTLRKCHPTAKIEIVHDGAEALDFLFASGRYSNRKVEDTPGMILLDLKLPKVNGTQVLQWVRADKRTKDIPVVVLTSFENDSEVVEIYKLGVSGYLLKPLDSESFLKLAAHLGLIKPGAASRKPNAARTGNS